MMNKFQNAVNHVTQLRKYAMAAVKQMLRVQRIELCVEPTVRKLMLGIHADESNRIDTRILTRTAWKCNLQKTGGSILDVMLMSGPIKIGQNEVEKMPYYLAIAIVRLGRECLGYNRYEEQKVLHRSAAKACTDLILIDEVQIDVEVCTQPKSAVEKAALGVWIYRKMRSEKNCIAMPTIRLRSHIIKNEICDKETRLRGLQKAAAQNLPQQQKKILQNIVTPKEFAQHVVEYLWKSAIIGEIKFDSRAESQLMNAFILVDKTSYESQDFLVLSYYGKLAEKNPKVLFGKGIKYDRNDLFPKTFEKLCWMRVDMTGAVMNTATREALAALRLLINITGLVSQSENFIGHNSFRFANAINYNKSNRDANHQDVSLIAGTHLYAKNSWPKFVVNVCTPSEAACDAFRNSETLSHQIIHTSMHTGGKVRRLPLWNYYKKQVNNGMSDDVQNYWINSCVRICNAAAFFKNSITYDQWMRLDATNVVFKDGKSFEYLRSIITERPAHSLCEIITQAV
uniref:Cytosol aminopeptidase domain-containing protein n=1 Tax=Glossina brevipalpis TaxID=37001 RepID=A0A1A9WGI8_9MUSC